MFSLIAAVGKNNELGKGNQLIFHIKDDMKFFRETTKGHPVVMGHKTWDSLPAKLPGRKNIVISRHDFEGPDEIVHDIDRFIEEYKDIPDEIFIIGGGTVYHQFLPFATTIYLTEVDAGTDDADTYFPSFDKTKYHKEVIRKGKDHDLTYSIIKYSK